MDGEPSARAPALPGRHSDYYEARGNQPLLDGQRRYRYPSSKEKNLGKLVALSTVLALAAISANPAVTAAPRPPVLSLERTLPLAPGLGRVDHMAADLRRGRLFVAELGSGAVEEVDLASGRSVGRIGGLKEPQGIGYLPERDELVVASGGDGSVRFYRGSDLSPVGVLPLGEDADNVRIDPRGRVVVGFGSGALAIIDPATRRVVAKIELPAHPESFQIDGDRAFVNLPDAGKIAVVDFAKGKVITTWENPDVRWNFPMAFDRASNTLAVVYRFPARLLIFDASSGRVIQRLETCGDSDDVFFDPARRRIYVSCGAGMIDVFERTGTTFSRAARIPTRPGARTSLFSVASDRLWVAARGGPAQAPVVLIFKPSP